jgi:hypothetical protein
MSTAKYAPVPEAEDYSTGTSGIVVQPETSRSEDFEARATLDPESTEVIATGTIGLRHRSRTSPPELLAPTTSAAADSATIHVRGVRAGPQADKELTRIFSAFGKVEDVVVRERFKTLPQESDSIPDAPTITEDTSWALVTMSSSAAVEAALRDGVSERMDPSRPLTLSRSVVPSQRLAPVLWQRSICRHS